MRSGFDAARHYAFVETIGAVQPHLAQRIAQQHVAGFLTGGQHLALVGEFGAQHRIVRQQRLRLDQALRQRLGDGKAGGGIGFARRHDALPRQRPKLLLHVGEAAHRTGHGMEAAARRRAGKEIEFAHLAGCVAHQADTARAQARRHRIGRGQGEEHGGDGIHGIAARRQSHRTLLGCQRLVGHRRATAAGFRYRTGSVGLGRVVLETHGRCHVIAQRADGLATAHQERGQQGGKTLDRHDAAVIRLWGFARPLCPSKRA